MRQTIHTDAAPQAIGTYSQAIKVGEVVYLSGQIGLDPKTMTLVSEEFKEQANQLFLNMQAVANAAQGELDKIVKLTVYLTNFADFPVFNEVMATYFKQPYPARTTIQVSALPKSAKIEVDAIMVV